MTQGQMSFKDKLIFWIVGIALLGLFLHMVSSILLPFVVALIAAYFLDPAADKLEDLGISRCIATITITSLFFLVVAGIAILITPLLYDQFISMIHKTPEYVRMFNEKVLPSFASVLDTLDPEAVNKAKGALSDASVYIFQFFAKMVGNIWSSGIAIVNLLSLIFITPIVTFYMLRDWDSIINKIHSWLPPKHASVIKEQVLLIDRTLSGYIRGQTNVCLLLGTFYAIGLTAVGLDFGFFIGMATGILSFIPYVGMLFGFTIGMIVAFFQFGDLASVAIVAAVFVTGQFIESNFVTPKLVGNKVGLHPVWIMFGMLAGAAMFGFTGILLAVPVTAVLGVLVRFFLNQYLKSIKAD